MWINLSAGSKWICWYHVYKICIKKLYLICNFVCLIPHVSHFFIMSIFAFNFINFFSKLSATFDDELAINLALSIKFWICRMILSLICFPSLPICFFSFIGTEKVICFLVFSPRNVNYPSRFSAKLFYDKLIIIVWSIEKYNDKDDDLYNDKNL